MTTVFVGLVPYGASTAQTTLQFDIRYGSAPDFSRYHWLALHSQLQLQCCCCCHQTDRPSSYRIEAVVAIGDSESGFAAAKK